MKTRLYYSFLLLFFYHCTPSLQKDSKNQQPISKSEINYAKGFDIQSFNSFKKLIIKSSSTDSNDILEYILISKATPEIKGLGATMVNVPIQKIVVSSTTHIPMLELLGVENSLVGFQNTDYISSSKTRKIIDLGLVKELGKEASMNTEVLFDLAPDVVIGFSMNNINKTYQVIKKHGIPVIINNDWLEETPLGRAEWIKFFGVLFNKEKEADHIFRKIEADYLEAKTIADKTIKQPTILSGAIMSNDIWSVPAGESFVAQFLMDANVNYLWKESKGKGSLPLSFESVFDKAQYADYWISPGYFSSKKQLLENNTHYKRFAAFINNQIYTASTKKGTTGGVIYYELGPIRPDLILKDIIKITHPKLLPDYQLTFFEKMK